MRSIGFDVSLVLTLLTKKIIFFQILKKMVYQRGQEVFRCEPFVYMVKSAVQHKVCDFCFHYIKGGADDRLKKCSSCGIVHYW